jgi:hypothetical protein
MEVDGAAEGAAPVPPKKMRVTEKKDIPFIAAASSLDSTILERFKD